jgi:DNA-binding LacI/PurR family transcriptional regulator
MATIYDIARAAGVTATTVSNVLKGKGSVSEATRARVLHLVEKMGYHPNLVARSLVKGRTGIIGLVVHSLSNPFFAEVTTTAERLAYAAGLRIFVNTLLAHDETGQQMLKDLVLRRIDGLLIYASSAAPSTLELIKSVQLPVVSFLHESTEEPLISPSVSFDFTQGGQLAAEHLVSLGHRRIGILNSYTVQEDGKPGHPLRLISFEKVLAEHGLEVLPEYHQAGRDRMEEGRAAGLRLLSQPNPPTAVFAANDSMAIGLISAAWELGFRVPEDLSIVGFDNLSLGQYVTPPLTSVAIDMEVLMTQAVNLLLQAMEGQPVTSPPLLPARLVIRGSTAPPSH